MRFFAGLTVDEAAEAPGVSPRTIELDWRMAKAWLSRALSEEGAG
jgi:DNA-directed RNA polymerase specialized sigma24 family protein